jgi:hypothetical protein
MKMMEKVCIVAEKVYIRADSEDTKQQKSLLSCKNAFTLMQKKFTFLKKRFTTFIKKIPKSPPNVNQCKPG